jgi:aryl-alcohol dehydrogenase-like predicted oxidoreductase
LGGWLAERVTERGIAAAGKVAALARECGLTSSQLAVLWVKDQPAVTAPILGPRTEAHLDDALPVLKMKLDAAVASALDAIVPPGGAVADFHNTSRWMRKGDLG